MSLQERQTVLVDMDGTAADFDARVLELFREEIPDEEPLAKRDNFYFGDDYPQHADVIRDIIRREGFFKDIPLVTGVLEGWQRIIDAGYAPRICSSPIEGHAFSRAEKIWWLEEHFVPEFGSWVVETAIFTRHKAAYDGIALIEDRPELPNQQNARWQHIVFNQPYNQEAQTDLRLHGWYDQDLESMLAICDDRYKKIAELAIR